MVVKLFSIPTHRAETFELQVTEILYVLLVVAVLTGRSHPFLCLIVSSQ